MQNIITLLSLVMEQLADYSFRNTTPHSQNPPPSKVAREALKVKEIR